MSYRDKIQESKSPRLNGSSIEKVEPKGHFVVLSSSLTYAYKYILPCFGIGFAFLLGYLHYSGSTGELLAIPLLIIIVLALFPLTILKQVTLFENGVEVSNFKSSQFIPFKEIQDIKINALINIQPVTIHLKNPSAFGRKIVFMPTVSLVPFKLSKSYYLLKNSFDHAQLEYKEEENPHTKLTCPTNQALEETPELKPPER